MDNEAAKRERLLQSTSEKPNLIHTSETPYQSVSGRRLYTNKLASRPISMLCATTFLFRSHRPSTSTSDHVFKRLNVDLMKTRIKVTINTSNIQYGLCPDDLQPGCQAIQPHRNPRDHATGWFAERIFHSVFSVSSRKTTATITPSITLA